MLWMRSSILLGLHFQHKHLSHTPAVKSPHSSRSLHHTHPVVPQTSYPRQPKEFVTRVQIVHNITQYVAHVGSERRHPQNTNMSYSGYLAAEVAALEAETAEQAVAKLAVDS